MLFLEIVNIDDYSVEYLDLSKVISIKHYDNGSTKILLGAGLSWKVYTHLIKIVNINDII